MNSEKSLRQIRQQIFNYPDNKADQADRVLAYLKTRVIRARDNEEITVGPYSGLTRAELRQSGTCETDWY